MSDFDINSYTNILSETVTEYRRNKGEKVADGTKRYGGVIASKAK